MVATGFVGSIGGGGGGGGGADAAAKKSLVLLEWVRGAILAGPRVEGSFRPMAWKGVEGGGNGGTVVNKSRVEKGVIRGGAQGKWDWGDWRCGRRQQRRIVWWVKALSTIHSPGGNYRATSFFSTKGGFRVEASTRGERGDGTRIMSGEKGGWTGAWSFPLLEAHTRRPRHTLLPSLKASPP